MMKPNGILFTNKLIKSIFLMTFLSLFAFANDDKNIEVLENMYDKVILKDVNLTLKDIESLNKSISKKDIKKSKSDFKNLVASWKSVETFYILGDLNEDYIDTPRYIDIYHNGNEDITKQLDRAIKSSDEPKVALFKNSTKSINALEYMLFTKDIKDTRVNEMTLYILNRIKMHMEDIKQEYLSQKTNYFKNLKKANAITVDAIIQNSYKLKEWRVGDTAGLSQKYKGKPDNRRAEYYLSKNSAHAIESILNTYKEVLDNEKLFDYGDFLISLTDGKEMKRLKLALKKSLELVKEIKNDDFSKAQDLYEQVNIIHVVLFVEMVEELSINAKILDADGD